MRPQSHRIIRLGTTLLLIITFLLEPAAGAQGPSENAQPATTFTPPYNISNSPDTSQHPRADVDDSNYLHVAWMEGIADISNGPAYVRGRGTTWPAWEWAGPQVNPGYTNPAIAVDSAGTAHVVWAGGGHAPYEIYYAYKPLGGYWSSPVNLSNEGDNTVYPSIAIDSQDRLWVVWQASLTDKDTDILARSKPAGGNWGEVMRIASSGQQDLNCHIAIDDNDVPHVTWRNNSLPNNWEILYSKYVGGSWTNPQNISANASGSHMARVATAGNNVYVVWEDDMDGPDRFQIVFRRWDGTQWLPLTKISSSTKALNPAMAADGNNIFVTWEDYRGGSKPEVYFSYSTDYGTTWLGNENVSQNGTSSYFPDIVAQSGGIVHIFWEDLAPGQWDNYYSQGTTMVLPPPPHGWVDVLAHDPANDPDYSRLLTVTLALSATSDVGNPITAMRICNAEACDPLPGWIPFATSVPNWRLAGPADGCGSRSVWVWFRDNLGTESITYTDHIFYDSNLAAAMVLNGNRPYTNRLVVTVNTTDLDGQMGCSGLRDMRLSENGITYTPWVSYTQDYTFSLTPAGASTRILYAEYRDHAGNTGVWTDSIQLDMTPPYSGTPPTMVTVTTSLLVTITGLYARDDKSGVANVWLANRPEGPWLSMPYHSPPYTYTWNLAYGGPPLQEPYTHTVYVKYEDASGYGDFPGNFSEVLSATISVSGIINMHLPMVPRTLGP